IGEALGSDRQRVAASGLDQIVGEDVLHELQRLVEQKLFVDSCVFAFDFAITSPQNIDMVANVTDLEQPRLHAIVEICREIRNLVGKIDQLRLERRSLEQQITRQLRMLFRRIVARMLDDALTNAQSQIKSTMRGITLFKVFDDAQCMDVVVKPPTMTAKATV